MNSAGVNTLAQGFSHSRGKPRRCHILPSIRRCHRSAASSQATNHRLLAASHLPFVSATTRITQPQLALPPRVDSQLALLRPLELQLPRSPRAVWSRNAQTEPLQNLKVHALAAHPAQPRDPSSRNSSHDRPNRPNHIQHRDQQDPNDPGLEIREVGLGRLVAATISSRKRSNSSRNSARVSDAPPMFELSSWTVPPVRGACRAP